MRAVTIAAAGAAVIGSVSASSHVKHMHAKLHANVARDTWADWNATSTTSTTTSEKPVDPKTTAATTTTTVAWEDWDTTTSSTTTTTTTTSKHVKPATTSSSAADTWEDWTSTTTTTTTTTPADPWVDWTTTSSKPVDPATTSSTEVWGDLTTSSPVDGASTSTVTETWGDWTTSSPVDPATTSTETWGDWTATEETTTTVTLESTKTTTKYVKGLTSGPGSGAWTASTPAAVTSVVTSTITPGWTSGDWFGPAWTVAADSCAIEVVTSYGAATWSPTPAAPAATSTTSATWVDWTSSTPAAAITTSSSSTSNATWADWTSTSTTSASPSATTTTSSAAGEWGWPTSASASASTTESGTGGSWGWSGSASASASASSTSSSAKPSGGSHGGSPGISANGNSWAMTYSPYTSSGGCKDAGTVATDLAVIAKKGFSSVRIYSTDCSALENVGTAARNNGLKIILGVWISSTGISGAQGQISDIVSWGGFDLVELVVIGNEAVFNGYCSASELAAFISSSASTFKAAGYTGLVTLTEPLSVWEDTSSAAAFLSVIDVCGANLYAFFNSDVTADKAGSFIQSEIDIMNGICSGKSVYVLESGWPHAGSCNGAACPSPENQATALKGIHSTVGAQVVFLSYEDEPWKAPGQFDVEQFWGCADVF